MDKQRLGDDGRWPVSPPSYEVSAQAEAYHTPLQSRRLLRGHRLSIRKVTAGIVFVLFSLWLLGSIDRRLRSQDIVLDASASRLLQHFDESRAKCEALSKFPQRPSGTRKENPRWLPKSGQQGPVILRNATLFDGEKIHPHPVDITFSKGLVVSVQETSAVSHHSDAVEHDVGGRWVSPGLVDMHSHHLSTSWPTNDMTSDDNEMTQETKAFPASARIIDGLKPYDLATFLIASGGVTSSLILPGSANIVAGEGIPVKNVLASGEHGEPVIEDFLLERGIPWELRHRYMKMAYGENPKSVWGYTRLGNAIHLREHLQKAKDLKEKQDDYCSLVVGASAWGDAEKATFIQEHGIFPFEINLESTVGVLRGRVLVQNHNYEPEDIETMLRISHEFGYRVVAFHHALEAWQIPELLKEQGDNVTIATFAEFSLYKQEAYFPSLYASRILNRHGVPVAFKSDHSMGFLSAKFLVSQAAVGHAFHLPETAALQSVTSVPAKALDLDYRIGYVRPGYDADLVIWDSHPLSLGATPLQVFIDGQEQLDQSKVKSSLGTSFTAEDTNNGDDGQPQVRQELEDVVREETCRQAAQPGQSFIVSGITKAFVDNHPHLVESLKDTEGESLELIIDNGDISCLGSSKTCEQQKAKLKVKHRPLELSLNKGYLLPGLTGVTRGLGLREIDMLEATGDGDAAGQKITDPESVTYAKYGVSLDGKQFARARLGGVTRVISPPAAEVSELVQGVSVEILTSGKKSLLDGGMVQDEVALHLNLLESDHYSEKTISNGIRRIRKALEDGAGKHNATVYGKVANGSLPLVVYSNSKYDYQQLILIKKDFPKVNLVILGGKEAPFVAEDLAGAKIPVILSEDRPSPDTYRSRDAVVGPPLTRSVGSYLTEAGVTYAVAIVNPVFPGAFRIHDLGAEAGWTAKFAGLNETETVRLITTNVETILGLSPSKDLVIFEGNPLKFGATVVLSLHSDMETGKLEVATCYPEENEVGKGSL